jgi:3-hydroxyisobutyrate dehydrogenase-like beta-hydroxyacid dehydrogenase
MQQLGFKADAISAEIGVSPAVKMCRSVMIKGLESLTVECLSAARHDGVERLALASLGQTFEKFGTHADPADYVISRVAEHSRLLAP